MFFTVTALLLTSCTSDGSAPTSSTPVATNTDGSPITAAAPLKGRNRLDPAKTTYQTVRLPDVITQEAQPQCQREGDGTLTIGGLLPETGTLDFLGPVQNAAVELAIQDINDAGGVGGVPVEFSPGDSGSDGSASNVANRHLNQNVDAIIGPPSSVLSKQVSSLITDSCVIHMSGANTASSLEPEDDGDMYFRTAPSDVLQGQALTELASSSAKPQRVSIVAATNTYGITLAELTKQAFEREEVEVSVVTYDPGNVEFNNVATETTRTDPEAIVLIGFEESAPIVRELIQRDVDKSTIYLSDGNAGDAFGEQFDNSGELTGIRGLQPGAKPGPEFSQNLRSKNPTIQNFSFGPETYDAVIVIAIAALLAGSDSPPAIAAAINGATSEGTTCTTFEACQELVNSGVTDINYDGLSGVLNFNRDGDATTGEFAVVEFG